MNVLPFTMFSNTEVLAGPPPVHLAVGANPSGSRRAGLRRLAWALGLSGLMLVAALPAEARNEAAAAAPSAADTSSALAAELTQMRVTVENGKEVLSPAPTVKPGDLIEYRVVYTNRSNRVLRDVVAELPIPAGLEYQPKSARPNQSAEAAVAGGAFGREPLMREAAGGKKEPVPYSEYRRLRWTLGQIAGGAKTVVSARARVSTGVPATLSGVQPAAPAADGR